MLWTDAFADALAQRYRLERELGEGGMATVYLAHDLRHDRKVAVKVLRAELGEAIGAERFLAEIRTTAGLSHPHILPLFDSGTAAGSLFFVMPVVEGETLRHRIANSGPLPIADAVRIAGEVASALEYAHRRGVIHRDIKPENILLQDGHALVADFGIALAPVEGSTRLTQTGVSVGTPQYMSPEQMLGARALDARTDVYATGILLYEMLTGDTPFAGATAQAIAAKVLTDRPPPPSKRRREVPPHLDAAVMTSIEREPERRFETAAAFQSALAGSTIAVRRPVRWRLLAGIAAAIVVATGAVVVVRRLGGTPTSARHAIAALPFRFQSFGGDTTRVAALADNMPQEILDALSSVPNVIVRLMPRDTRFRNVTDPRRVAPELDADIILMGDMTLEGDSIRITIRPYDVRLNRVMTPIPFTSSAQNVMALEDSISRGVAARLQLGEESPQRLGDARRARSVNPAAHEALIRARWYVESRQCSALDSAVALLTAATRLDPGYVEAWASLGQTHNLRAAFWCAPGTTAFPQARIAVQAALRLDSTSAAAHTAGAFLALFGDWNAPTAREEFRRSVQLDSTRSETWLYRAWYYLAIHSLDSTRWSIRRAKDLDPTSSIIRTRVGSALYLSDSVTAARDEIEEVLRHEPRFATAIVQIAPIYADLNQCERVRALMQAEPALAERGFGGIGYARARCGDVAGAHQMIALWTVMRARGEYVPAIEIAAIHAGLRDSTKVYEWLHAALTERDWQMIHLRTLPAFAAYRASPTFQGILRRIGATVPVR